MNSLKIPALLLLIAMFSAAAIACGSDEPASQPERDGDAMMEKNGDAMMEKDGDAMTDKDGDAMMHKGDVASAIAGFSLESFTVKAGTTITWSNDHGAPHTVSHRVADSDPPQTGDVFDSPTLSTGNQFSHTFSEAGTFQYYCEIHPGSMRATITVEAK